MKNLLRIQKILLKSIFVTLSILVYQPGYVGKRKGNLSNEAQRSVLSVLLKT